MKIKVQFALVLAFILTCSGVTRTASAIATSDPDNLCMCEVDESFSDLDPYILEDEYLSSENGDDLEVDGDFEGQHGDDETEDDITISNKDELLGKITESLDAADTAIRKINSFTPSNWSTAFALIGADISGIGAENLIAQTMRTLEMQQEVILRHYGNLYQLARQLRSGNLSNAEFLELLQAFEQEYGRLQTAINNLKDTVNRMTDLADTSRALVIEAAASVATAPIGGIVGRAVISVGTRVVARVSAVAIVGGRIAMTTGSSIAGQIGSRVAGQAGTQIVSHIVRRGPNAIATIFKTFSQKVKNTMFYVWRAIRSERMAGRSTQDLGPIINGIEAAEFKAARQCMSTDLFNLYARWMNELGTEELATLGRAMQWIR